MARSKSTSGGRYKRELRGKAAARLRCHGSLAKLFTLAGEALGVTWQPGAPHSKAHGYQLLARLLDRDPPAAKASRPVRAGIDPLSDAFLLSYEWRRLRMTVLVERGARCECCGHTAKDGVKIHVDHIKPRRRHPELALDKTNLQILCEVCNHGKGNWDETDWREGVPAVPCWSNRIQ